MGGYIPDRTGKTASVGCQSSTLSEGHVENIPYVPFPPPSRSSSFSFPVYLSLQDDFSQALASLQMTKILQLL